MGSGRRQQNNVLLDVLYFRFVCNIRPLSKSKIKTCELKCDAYPLSERLFQVLPIYGVTPHVGQAKAKHNKHEYRENIDITFVFLV